MLRSTTSKTLQTLLEQRKRCAGAIEEKIEEKDEFLRWEGVGTGIARKRECILLGIDVEEEEVGGREETPAAL